MSLLKYLAIILLFLTSNSIAAKTIKIMEIDTGVDLSHEEISNHVKLVDKYNYIDGNGHGTHIAGIILKDTCKEVELISCKYYPGSWSKEEERILNTINCYNKALELKVDFVNYSSAGMGYSVDEEIVLRKLIKNNIKVIVASGNEGLDLNKISIYPAAYRVPGVIVVGNLGQDGKPYRSNYGLKDMVWEIGTAIYSTLPRGLHGWMTGSSQATAVHSNKLIKEMCNK